MLIPSDFTSLLDECTDLIDQSGLLGPHTHLPVTEPLPSLLERCAELVEQGFPEEPVRTIHHFACTGGTLVAKCLASMPNTRVLSEVEPHSRLPLLDDQRFFPTDLVQLLRVGTYDSNTDLESEVFLGGFKPIYTHCRRQGLRLVVRDHAHSKYCVGEAVVAGPSLRELLASEYRVQAIVTVRHPLDSYLSLLNNGWRHFQPASLEEYCRRYLRCLRDHEQLPVFKYEDLVDRPAPVMEEICSALDVPYDDSFPSTFGVHRLSGDSGRSDRAIGKRSRRPVSPEVAEQLDSGAFAECCSVLGYEIESGEALQP